MNKNIMALVCLSASVLFAGCGKDEEEPVPQDNDPIFVPIDFGSATFGSVTDIDGNIYKTVVIGDLTWMAENLRVTKFQNGEAILAVREGSTWTETTSPAYYNYNDDANMISLYGRLYNSYVREDVRNVCPSGWHVPAQDEWRSIDNTLNPDPANKLREKGTAHWISKNVSTNESGFTGMPGGSIFKGNLTDVGTDGYWWTTTGDTFYYLTNTISTVRTKNTATGDSGMSIRCVQD